jgi:hypothetical protein
VVNFDTKVFTVLICEPDDKVDEEEEVEISVKFPSLFEKFELSRAGDFRRAEIFSETGIDGGE